MTTTKGNDTTDCTVVLSPEHPAQLRASGITDEIDPSTVDGVCDMLNALHAGGQYAYWSRFVDGNHKATWWEVGKPVPVPSILDLYFPVSPTLERGQAWERSTNDKGRAVACLNTVYAEFDAKDRLEVTPEEIQEHGSEKAAKQAKLLGDLDGYKAQALAAIQEIPIPPSILIDSGGGYHAYWLLSETFHLRTPEDRKRAARIQGKWVVFVGGDTGSHDLCRLLRVPMTLNCKYSPPRPVEFVQSDLDIRYSLDDIETLANTIPDNTVPTSPKWERKNGHEPTGDRPGDDWAAHTTWHELMEGAGWIRLWERGGTDYYQRPGRERKGVSATVNYGGSDLLYVFTSSVPALDAGSSYTKFGAYTALYHQGDFSSATRALVALGFGKKAEKKFDEKEQKSDSEGGAALIVDHTPTLDDVYDAYARGQAGDAELLAKLKGGKILYDHSEKAWFVWAGHSWAKDRARSVDRIVATELASLYLTAAAAQRQVDTDSAQAFSKKLQARAGELYNRARRDSVLDQAMTLDELKITGDEWDADPWKLAVENGVIDLHNGQLSSGQPSDYIRSVAPVEWKGLDEPCPTWERFISEILVHANDPQKERVSFLRRLLGYGITGLRQEHVFPILCGPDGRNGKGTLKEVLSEVFGPALVRNTPADSLLESKGRDGNAPKPFLYDLQGKRLIFASELNENARVDLALIKGLAGGDTITARTLHSQPKSFKPSHLLFLITNPLPRIDADDTAVWDRVALIEFTQRFVDNPQEPNEHKRDAMLDKKLLAEKSGILAWLVRGCLEWQRIGLSIPECVRASTREYRANEDVFGQFVEARIVEVPNGRLYIRQAYEKTYRPWSVMMGYPAMTTKAFQKKLRERFWKGHSEELPKDDKGTYYPGLSTTDTITIRDREDLQ